MLITSNNNKIIDGKKIASEIKQELIAEIKELKKNNIYPTLALLLIGDDPASKIYVKNKQNLCGELGINSTTITHHLDITEEEIIEIINKWNNNPNIHGILVQLPLPNHINENKILLSIEPEKDVDGFHPQNIGKLVAGMPTYIPCTPLGIYELLKRSNFNIKGKHCVVVGRSNIVGKPIANILLQKSPNANATVTICHSATPSISNYTKQADIIIAAVGIPNFIKKEDIKEEAIIIDVGINRIKAENTKTGYRIVGDVDFDDVIDKVSAITPVPGGVGPMTIVMLIKNTISSAKKKMAK